MRRRHRLAGAALAAAAVTGLGTGCAGPASEPAPAGAATSGPATMTPSVPPAAAPVTPPGEGSPPPSPATEIEVRVRDGRVDPPPDRVPVALGERVRLTVTSDVADEVHVHGYDEEARLEPGQPATVEFVADEAGQFEVETHESSLVLLTLLVR